MLNVHRNHEAYKGRRGEGDMESGGWEREIIYLSLYCHHQNDFCIKMGSDESQFNVSVGSNGQSHRTVSTNHNLFEEKGEPKQIRTEVPLTSLTSYRWAKPAFEPGQTHRVIYGGQDPTKRQLLQKGRSRHF